MFSPYYAWARARAGAAGVDPAAHCAVNVALYRRGGNARWAMTERGASRLDRSRTALQVGPSRLAWRGDTLVVHIDEVTVPWPSRVRGEVRLHPSAMQRAVHRLDAQGRHLWQPIAPVARVEVDLDAPAMRWHGDGYLDTNRGDEPLELGFTRWDWSRAALPGRATTVLYDAEGRDGRTTSLALQFTADGRAAPIAAPPSAALPASAWHLARRTRGDAGHGAEVLQTLEDGPFYARSIVAGRWLGWDVMAVHESLDLERFRRRIVQAMLPFRMPRRSGRRA